MRKTFLVVLIGIAVFVLSACGGPSVQPLDFRAAPWSAGEVSQYDLLDRNRDPVGAATWSWERTANQWQQRYDVTVNGVLDTGVVVLDENLKPLRSSREVGGKRYDATYGDKTVNITVTAADGTTTTKSVPAVADGIDNDVSLQAQRALPLAANYVTRYTDIIPTTASSAPIVLSVTGAETVTVPAGTFTTWHVKMAFSGTAHEGWYAQQPPYAMVKYQNGASGAVFELRYIGTGPAPTAPGASSGAATPAPAAAGAATGAMPPVNLWLLVAILAVQLPVMIGLPVLLGWYIHRRWGVAWGAFAVGVLSFVLSQLIHIPLNLGLGLLGQQTRGVALWALFPKGLVVGLSAGVCEEGARLLVVGLFARNIRGWRAGLQFGAGHGGAESIILGLLAALNIGAILASRSMGALGQALPADVVAQLQAAQGVFWGQSAGLPLVAALERIFAIMLQITLAVLVVTAVTRRRPLYLLLALALHTVADGWIIWAQSLGVAAIEAGVGLAAIFGLWLVWRLREQPAVNNSVLESEPGSGPVPPAAATAADLTERQLSPEELARRAERSRYE